MKMNYGRIALCSVLMLSLQACSREPSLKNAHLQTIEPHALANTLFYSGSILPLKTIVVTSPADGAIVEMPFQYGETIEAGQLLYTLSSAKFLTDYKTALMQYIKAKSDYNAGQTQLSEAEFLHKHELISDDEFKTKQGNFYGARLALVQAKDALEVLIHQLDLKDINLYKLTIADIDKITQAMHLQRNSENLRILAPASGVVLAASKNDDDTKKLAKGDVVKQGDVLAIIGDMSGLSVRVKVNELTVNQLKVGQKVQVSGIAFPEHVLSGEIRRVDRQGDVTNTGGGMPTFSVEIMVPKLTLAQQNEIHVGMSAKVEINIEEAQQMMIPIAAVKDHKGVSFVQRYDAKAGKLMDAPVKTGKTTPEAVAVLAGLKAGDRIVVPD